MRFCIGSDAAGEAPNAIADALREHGHEVELYGPLAGNEAGWADVARDVASRVAAGSADQGVLFCWTGTGVSIAANKMPGIRAALCGDAETARGARAWNDANVLCLSLRTTTPILAREILDAWLSASPDPSEAEQIAHIEIAS
jgi:ribose 5-phosphate isomerase B